MSQQKPADDKTAYTMDDIARRFLSTAPKPDRQAPKAKPKKKSKAKARSAKGR